MDYVLIGSMEARHRGAVLDLGGLKQRAVLAVLLLARGRAVDFDRIVDDVWNGDPPLKAVSSLRAYVANLRRVLDPTDEPRRGRLITTAGGYRLDLVEGSDTVDLDRFEQFCGAAREAYDAGDALSADLKASDALRLWRGRPLADFRDHTFAVDETQRLERMYADTFEIRVDARLRHGAGASLVPELEARLSLDPLREKLWAQLMLALNNSGRRADALSAFDRVRRTLAAELGVEPGDELARTHDEIRGRQTQQTVGPHRTVFGRDDELAQMHRTILHALSGRGRIVLVTGDSGMGKTALASEISADALEAGFVTAWSSCSGGDRKPVQWTWTRILHRLGEQGSQVPGTAGAISSALRGAIGSTPTLIVLDDFHLADTGSQEVLAEMEKWVADVPLVVVATWQDGSPALPRRKTFHDRAAAGSAITVLPLAGLDGAAVAALIEHMDGASPSAGVVDRILTRTAGNPLYVRESVRMSRADGGVAPATDDRAEAT